MKNPNKLTMTAFVLILLLTVSAFFAAAPSANAAVIIRDPYTVFAYVSANPSPIGVGQTALVTYRVDQPAAGALVRSGHFNGTSVTITKPDGTTELKQNLEMDSTSSGWFAYVPTQTGTYYFQMHFPQNQYWINTTANQNHYTYLADDSSKVPLEVQANPIPGYDRSPPLPTGYWTRPINAENKGWWEIADNWLMQGYRQTGRSFAGNPAFAPYTSGPQSAHVLWTEPIVPGGIAGGMYGDRSYYTGISYEQYFEKMCIQGTIFYTRTSQTGSQTIGTEFMDLYTGEVKENMYMDGVEVAFAQILNIDTPNEHGPLAYLWVTSGSTWYMYDYLPNRPPTLRVTLTGMSGLTGFTTQGPNGEILSYNIGGNSSHRYLYMFNSTRAILGLRYSGIDVWTPSGEINASRALNASPNGVLTSDLAYAISASNSPYMGIEWNVTLPDVAGVSQNERLVNVEEGLLLATATDSSRFPYVYSDVGYDIGAIKKDTNGLYPSSIPQLFAYNRTMIHDIHDRTTENLRSGTYVRYDEGEEVYYCFDARTGLLKWQSTPLNNAWALFTRIYIIAYGKLVTSGFDGIVRCWDINDGKILWEYSKGSAGFENAYGTYPEYAGLTIADRTVYCTADEHSSDGVLWRGSQLWAIDIDTGELKFSVSGMYRHPIVVDGILVALNSYDGQAYAFGKGPSKTTVAAPQIAVPKGTAVMLTGTVTDQTTATKDTPAISDADMSEWMEYLHMQKVIPQDAKGVEVTLTAVDPNGNSQTIGTTTTNIAGSYGITWTPPVEGQYTITATFAGSNSYGGSYDMTYFVVGPAAAVPQPTATAEPTAAPTLAPTAAPTVSPSVVPEPEAAPSTDIYIIAAAAAVIIIVFAVAAVFLRKRK